MGTRDGGWAAVPGRWILTVHGGKLNRSCHRIPFLQIAVYSTSSRPAGSRSVGQSFLAAVGLPKLGRPCRLSRLSSPQVQIVGR